MHFQFFKKHAECILKMIGIPVASMLWCMRVIFRVSNETLINTCFYFTVFGVSVFVESTPFVSLA